MRLLVRSWNLYHGRTHPPSADLHLEQMVRVATADAPDAVALQEVPLWAVVVIALIVTPEGFPLAYEVMPGNTCDKTTLKDFLAKIEKQYGKAQRIWVMDRGIPTEEILKQMRENSIDLLKGFEIKVPDPNREVENLSGGQRQRLL